MNRVYRSLFRWAARAVFFQLVVLIGASPVVDDGVVPLPQSVEVISDGSPSLTTIMPELPLPATMRALGTLSKRSFGEAFAPLGKNQPKPSFPSPPLGLDALTEIKDYATPGVTPNSLGRNDLLVKVHACGVNPLDFKERGRGTPISGYDVSGVVVAVGGNPVEAAGAVGKV